MWKTKNLKMTWVRKKMKSGNIGVMEEKNAEVNLWRRVLEKNNEPGAL